MAATISDVAKCAGVGVGTVSRVLNGGKSVNESTQQAVKDAIEKLHYVPNSMAKRLRENKNGVMALMVPVIYHPFFAKLADYIEKEAAEFGYSLLIVASQQHVEKENDIINRIIKKEVDGAIFVTHYDHSPEQLNDCPLVSIDRHLADGVAYVTSNNYDATVNAVEYLIKNGCEKVAYLGTKPLVDSEVMLREKAYRDVMEKHGRQAIVFNEIAVHGAEPELVERFFARHSEADGVFASGYSTAQCLCGTAIRLGKRIPEDLQVVAYDGTFNQWENMSITCVEQPIEDMARAAVRLLADRINGKPTPLRCVFESTFVTGNTTK